VIVLLVGELGATEVFGMVYDLALAKAGGEELRFTRSWNEPVSHCDD